MLLFKWSVILPCIFARRSPEYKSISPQLHVYAARAE